MKPSIYKGLRAIGSPAERVGLPAALAFHFGFAQGKPLLALRAAERVGLPAALAFHFGFAQGKPLLALRAAERVGFEPTGPCGPAVFKTAAIDHSATSPDQEYSITGGRRTQVPVRSTG
jgi:hypothetical protein